MFAFVCTNTFLCVQVEKLLQTYVTTLDLIEP